MSFFDSLRLAIALGLTLFLVLLRFDSERITRSDYFRYRTPWMGPVSYYILVIGFAIGIAVILPSGRNQLFLPGHRGSLLGDHGALRVRRRPSAPATDLSANPWPFVTARVTSRE